jgi:hypothetical protein
MVRGIGRIRRGLAVTILVAAAALLQGAAAEPVEAAQSGLSFVSTGTWIPDPAAGLVQVILRVTVTSHTVDSGSRLYYFAGLQLNLPPSSAAFAATDGTGESLQVSVKASTPYGVVVSVAFSQRLYSGQQGSFELDFDVVDSGGSTDRDLHIGQDIVSFPVSAFGSPGAPGSSATVIFPVGFTAQEQFGDLTSTTDSLGETVFASGSVPDATAVNAWFTASKSVPAGDFRVRYVTVGPLQVTLRYWSDDPGWADQIARVLQSGYPILREQIGLGDPTATSLTVEEATTQGIGGFSGEYDQSNGLVQVSYFADPMVILHEVAHMWFNADLASDRWIDEAFASFYAEQAVLQLGLADHAPVLSDALLGAAIPLNAWTGAEDPGSATEAYLYAGSLEAAREIAKVAGLDGLRQVWVQARAGQAAYARPNASASESAAGGVMDWRRFLDYLEQTTGKSYTAIWRQWVLTSTQTSLLDQRGTALSDYQDTQALASDWDLPPDVRQALGSWQFDQAQAMLRQVREILGLRQEIATAAPIEGTTPPATLRTTFETVGTSAAATEAVRELSVLSELAAARQAQADNVGAARAVGLLGTDPDADLAAARKAFAEGDNDRAASLADSARSAWAGAAGAGQIRILGTAAGSAGVLLLLALYIWTRPRRRPEEDRESEGDSPAADSGDEKADG